MFSSEDIIKRFITQCKVDPNYFDEEMKRYEKKHPKDFKIFLDKLEGNSLADVKAKVLNLN